MAKVGNKDKRPAAINRIARLDPIDLAQSIGTEHVDPDGWVQSSPNRLKELIGTHRLDPTDWAQSVGPNRAAPID